MPAVGKRLKAKTAISLSREIQGCQPPWLARSIPAHSHCRIQQRGDRPWPRSEDLFRALALAQMGDRAGSELTAIGGPRWQDFFVNPALLWENRGGCLGRQSSRSEHPKPCLANRLRAATPQIIAPQNTANV